jgi:hypothetical protein
MPSTTIMARRSCFDRVGLLDESLVYGDWEICIRLLSQYRTGFINRPLARYRVHASNTSIGPGVSPEKAREDARAVLAKVSKIVNQFDGDLGRLLKAIEKSFANVERRYARINIDRFVRGPMPDLNFLRTAWKASRRDVYRSRETPTILEKLIRLCLSTKDTAERSVDAHMDTRQPNCEDV